MTIQRKLIGVMLAGLLFSLMASPAAAQEEGIKVHGDWVIEVRNPDGTIVARHEFKNALTWTGTLALAGTLGRTYTPVAWGIRIGSPCQHDLMALRAPCLIVEPGAQSEFGPTRTFSNLAISVTGGELTLSGSVTATRTDTIDRVATQLTDASFHRHIFTEKNLPTPVPVTAGQIVQVTVRISFS